MPPMRRYTEYDRFAWIYNQHWGAFSQLVVPLLEQMILHDDPPARACWTWPVAPGMSPDSWWRAATR